LVESAHAVENHVGHRGRSMVFLDDHAQAIGQAEFGRAGLGLTNCRRWLGWWWPLSWRGRRGGSGRFAWGLGPRSAGQGADQGSKNERRKNAPRKFRDTRSGHVSAMVHATPSARILPIDSTGVLTPFPMFSFWK